ncbi:MAG: SRPBCC domain-containing protein [Conexivisphaerales archaeon]
MQLEFTGKEEVKSPLPLTSKFLSTPEDLAKSIPEAEEVKVLSEDEFEAKVKVKISVISSTMKVRMKVLKSDGNTINLHATSSGTGSSVEIKTQFNLSATNSHTSINWKADVSISGLIAGLGSSTLKVFAEKYIRQIVANLHEQLEKKTA